MKTQIKFQKILFLVTLIIAALTLVYGFAYCTGALTYAFSARSGQWPSAALRRDPINADALYSFVIGGEYEGGIWSKGSGFNDIIVILGVVFVVIAALQFLFATNSRRNYYITNYISVGVLAVFAVVIAAVGFWGVSHTEALFNDLNWSFYKEIYDGVKNEGGMGWQYYSDSHAMFDIGYVLYALVLVDAVLLCLNTVWKVLLMKGEKRLLSQNSTISVEEAANEQGI